MSDISEDLTKKVTSAASENFTKYYEEFAEMDPADLFKTAYLHGFNCAYNIYDVAEEKLEDAREDEIILSKDIPEPSLRVLDGAEELLKKDKRKILHRKGKDIYIEGYRNGFWGVWDKPFDEPVKEEMYKLTDYYLLGKMD